MFCRCYVAADLWEICHRSISMTFRVFKGTKYTVVRCTGPVQHVAIPDSRAKCTADFTEKCTSP